jgi:hypothetical protein
VCVCVFGTTSVSIRNIVDIASWPSVVRSLVPILSHEGEGGVLNNM